MLFNYRVIAEAGRKIDTPSSHSSKALDNVTILLVKLGGPLGLRHFIHRNAEF